LREAFWLRLRRFGKIEANCLYTIRKGELVRDNVNDRLQFSDHEMIKVREPDQGAGCIFYDVEHSKCTIYHDRPSQCRAFTCKDDTQFRMVFEKPKCTRKDLIRDPNLLRLISTHDKTCGYPVISDLVKQIETQGETAVGQLLKILKYDQDIRKLTVIKLGLNHEELNLLYGRPLTQTIYMFGLKAETTPEGSFLLTVQEDI
jgi:hypothetical protein